MHPVRSLAVIGLIALMPWQALAADAAPPAGAPASPAPAGAPAGPGESRGYARHWDKITNHTGFLTKDAWMDHAAKRFAEIDTNGDGKISKDEMLAHREKMRKMRQEMRERRESESDWDSAAH